VGEPDSALAAFEMALGLQQGDVQAWTALEAADLMIGQRIWNTALHYADLAAGVAVSREIGLRAVQAAALALTEQGRGTEAADRYRAFINSGPLSTELLARANMDLGQIYGGPLSDWMSAAGAYRQAALAAGGGETWARALWASAEALAAAGEYPTAVTELQPVADAGGTLSQAASDRIGYWRRYHLVDLQAGLRAIQGALMAMAAGGDQGRAEAVLEIARINARALKDFETAIAAYDRYLEDPGPLEKQARAWRQWCAERIR